ncbi:MAG: hypothetical protein GX435_01150 [Exilispira sp.]|nr:hypothetical protein [Exilispira sp.]
MKDKQQDKYKDKDIKKDESLDRDKSRDYIVTVRFYISLEKDVDSSFLEIVDFLKISKFKILKKSIDARNKEHIVAEYNILCEKLADLTLKNIQQKIYALSKKSEKGSKSKLYRDVNNYNLKKPGYLNIQKLSIEQNLKKESSLDKSEKFTINLRKHPHRPIIVGFGPCGIFAALALVSKGVCPVIIEMGEMVEKRDKDIEQYIQKRQFNEHSNIVFGEGGAGTYSDGKLYTRSRNELNKEIFSTFIYFGAPVQIEYDAHPHIGSDNLKVIIPNIRDYLQKKGASFFFANTLVDLEKTNNKEAKGEGVWRVKIKDLHSGNLNILETDTVILATGHNNRFLYKILYNLGVKLSPKPFALGFRVEHPKVLIDNDLYGKYAQNLPSAIYNLKFKGKSSNVFSFCMCPGGEVLPANSKIDEIVTNGASRFARDSQNSNSAIVCSVNPGHIRDFYQDLPERVKSFIRFSNFFDDNIINNLEIEIGLINPVKIRLSAKDFDYDLNFINELSLWEYGIVIQQLFEKITYRLSDLYHVTSSSYNIGSSQATAGSFVKKLITTNFIERKEVMAKKRQVSYKDYTEELEKLNEITSYPFGLYPANILNLFPENLIYDFMNAFKYFDRIIPGFIGDGIAEGFETRTSSSIQVGRTSAGEAISNLEAVVDGLFVLGEGSGWASGITTCAIDGWKAVMENY